MPRFINSSYNWFLPTPANNFQANIIKPFSLLSLFLFLCLINIVGISSYQRNSVLGTQDNLTESQLISLTNLQRTQAGITPLRPNPLLGQAAMSKAKHMVDTGNFDHYYQTDGQEVSPWQFILDSGYSYLHAGENLGKDFDQAETLVEAWMNSPAHKANLLNSQYTEIGIAVYHGQYLDKKQTTLIVQIFATPLPPGATPTDQQPPAINTAPLIEHNDSWISSYLNQYPIIIFLISALISTAVGVSIFIDLNRGRKLRHHHLSSQLWLK